jgi:hypothetical protein
MLVVVVLMVCLLWLAPNACAASTGAISGEVTEISTHTPIAGLSVCADSLALLEEESESINIEGDCAKTGATGEYTISGLPVGKYVVMFGSLFESDLNYVTEYYEGRHAFSEADVAVSAGATTTGIDAELEVGGEIAGTVTSAVTGAPITDMDVCALGTVAQAGGRQLECAATNAAGEYLIVGLAAGNFDVVFFGEGYIEQLYDGKSALAEANVVSVTVKNITSGINASLQPGTSSPTSSVSPSGSLEAPPPGSPSLGSRPGASGRSTPLLAGKRVAVARNGDARVKVDCAGAARCRARLTLETERIIKVKGKDTQRIVTIGTSVDISIAAGKVGTAHLKVDAAERSLLSDHGHLRAELVIVTPARVRDESVVLIERMAPGKK